MSDLVVALRNYIPGENEEWVPVRIGEAANEIERLRMALKYILENSGERTIRDVARVALTVPNGERE